MATKKFIIKVEIEVEEGVTMCEKCPLLLIGECHKIVKIFTKNKCSKINLATMKIKSMEENNEDI